MTTTNTVTISAETVDLDEWTLQAVSEVKRSPGSIEARLQLFKLYCVQADWDRALRQLDTLVKIEPESKRQSELYKNLLLSERMRELVLSGEREAGSLEGQLPAWTESLQRANALYAAGQEAEGEVQRAQALNEASARAGHGEMLGDFEWLADGDERLGPICEFICAGGYRWVPFADIELLKVSAPQGLMDLVWAPAQLVVNGKTWHGYVPARYPVQSDSDTVFKTGLETAWQQQGEGRYIGQGRKMWISNVGEYSVFEAGEIQFGAVGDEGEA
ncbi:type VI secretion system accessory protein TagJ [Serratia sp. UGAL515B_01]|uniref:type VI secretion system accessory protein TagJ n=1 Tax=Serratia sp. UGAL515B_01 TaxID=2986763 RepID=UPI002952C8BB|nr:type VI secretion system accessory protein TagJ [Serratia sp. UGAL515B_01]WON77493.1 ImpE family T6SS protein Cts1E [Serratia sp. UGAL515B_01]